jgi:hypothetical protein
VIVIAPAPGIGVGGVRASTNCHHVLNSSLALSGNILSQQELFPFALQEKKVQRRRSGVKSIDFTSP